MDLRRIAVLSQEPLWFRELHRYRNRDDNYKELLCYERKDAIYAKEDFSVKTVSRHGELEAAFAEMGGRS